MSKVGGVDFGTGVQQELHEPAEQFGERRAPSVGVLTDQLAWIRQPQRGDRLQHQPLIGAQARLPVRRQRIEFDITYIFERELRLLLERNGLKVERVFGNYDGAPVRPNSPRLIARCCPADAPMPST